MTYYHTAKQIQLSLQIIRQCHSWSPDSLCWGRVKMLRNELNAKPEPTVRSARKYRYLKASANCEARVWEEKGSGEGHGEPLSNKFWKIPTWNRAIWGKVKAKFYIFISLPTITFLSITFEDAKPKPLRESRIKGNPKQGQSPRVNG